jgi:hypothetical protein
MNLHTACRSPVPYSLPPHLSPLKQAHARLISHQSRALLSLTLTTKVGTLAATAGAHLLTTSHLTRVGLLPLLHPHT